MADEETQRLTILMQAKFADFERAMDRNNRRMTRHLRDIDRGTRQTAQVVESRMHKMGMSLAGFGKTFVVGLGAGVISAGLSQVTSDVVGSVRAVAQLGDEARRAGVRARDLQEWKYVAEQNRIGMDQMVDGLKEMNLRADEFVLTGKGPAAEAFDRLGYGSDELKEKLKAPSDLLLEIIGRLGYLDKAAQIRVADEIFGGSAGERFVELIAQGEDGLRKTIQRAHEVGAVMDDEMIRKADELDRKFNDLARSAGLVGKRLAVGVADGVASGLEALAEMIALGGTMADQAGRLTGNTNLPDALREDGKAASDAAPHIDKLAQVQERLAGEASDAARDLRSVVEVLDMLGEDDPADRLDDLIDRLDEIALEAATGKGEAADLRDRLSDVAVQADEALSGIAGIDGVSLDQVMGRVARLIGLLGQAKAASDAITEGVPEASGKTPLQTFREADAQSRRNWQDEQDKIDAFLAGEVARNAKTRERLALEREIADVQKEAGEAGVRLSDAQAEAAAKARLEADARRNKSGGGGGGSTPSFEDSVKRLQERTASLQAEALALDMAARAGKAYGGSIEFARRKAELLVAAQRAGIAITPELEARVDALALAYARAGESVEAASDKLDQMEEHSQRGAQALSDLFMGVLEGADSARAALSRLIAMIAEAQLQKGIASLAGSGGFLGALGELLSFDGGGYTGKGARTGGMDGKGGFLAMLHPDETVIDHSKPDLALGKAMVVPGQAVAQGAAQPSAEGAVEVRMYMDDDGTWRAEVERISGNVAASISGQMIAQNNGRVSQAQRRG